MKYREVYRLCDLVDRFPGYRFGGPGWILAATIFPRSSGLEQGPLSLVSATEELLEK
jgi:hypothetical protein